MKHELNILTIVLYLLLLPIVSYADGPLENGGGKHNDYFFTKGNDGGTFTSFKVQPTSSFLALKDASMNVSVIENKFASNVNFGVYTFDNSMNILNEKVWTNMGSTSSQTFYSQNMTAGDMVGFWVEVDGNKYYSVNSMNGNSANIVDWKVNHGELKLDFNVDGKKSADIKLSIKAQAAKPRGQPLPGILLTVCLGMIGCFVVWRKNKFNKC